MPKEDGKTANLEMEVDGYKQKTLDRGKTEYRMAIEVQSLLIIVRKKRQSNSRANINQKDCQKSTVKLVQGDVRQRRYAKSVRVRWNRVRNNATDVHEYTCLLVVPSSST